MPLSDFLEGMMYEAMEPFGDRRGDIQAGMVCSMLANIHRTKDRKPYTIHDFVPDWEPKPQRAQTPEEQLAIFLGIQATQNAIVEAHGGS